MSTNRLNSEALIQSLKLNGQINRNMNEMVNNFKSYIAQSTPIKTNWIELKPFKHSAASVLPIFL